jgi:hypothetical protein
MTPADVNARSVDYADKQMQLDQTDPTNAIVALAGGGQANAIAFTKHVNRVVTVATAADSVKLPLAVAGCFPVIVINAAGANSMNVFPSLGDAINALSANTAFAMAANKTAIFFCAVSGTWNSILTA